MGDQSTWLLHWMWMRCGGIGSALSIADANGYPRRPARQLDEQRGGTVGADLDRQAARWGFIRFGLELAADDQTVRLGEDIDRRSDTATDLAASPAVADAVRLRRARGDGEANLSAFAGSFELHDPTTYSPRTARAMIAGMRADSVAIDGGLDGTQNMRRDSDLLRRCAAGELAGAIRLYWFAPPCLSLGRLEPLSDVDSGACGRDGVDVIRRPSGGRAVLHDDEVTYAVVCRADDAHFGGDVMTSCARIHHAVAAGLALVGVRTVPHALERIPRRTARARAADADCFARPGAHELLDDSGRKLVGSAQARRGGALLQHGSVLLSPSRAANYLTHRQSDAATANGSRHSASAGLRALAGRDLTRDEVAQALAEGFRTILCAQVLDTTG